jgi:diguanylate cyclase (GGDEF)-like protein/PAS domain S-box-containing protein
VPLSEPLLHAVLDNLDAAVFVTDLDGRIQWVNAGFSALYGRRPASVIGREASLLGPMVGRPDGALSAEGEVVHHRADGLALRVRLRRQAVTAENGKVTEIAYIGRMLDEADYLRQELRRLQDDLDIARKALAEVVTHDEVTGLYNPRQLRRFIAEEIGRSRRSRQPLSLLLVDINGWKKLRTEHGDGAADDVLRGVAAVLRGNLRAVDRAARHGEGELGVLLPDAFADDAVQVAERLRQLVASKTFSASSPRGERVDLTVTLSFGVAGLHEGDDAPETLVAAANRALAEAKSRGASCVVAFVDLG